MNIPQMWHRESVAKLYADEFICKITLMIFGGGGIIIKGVMYMPNIKPISDLRNYMEVLKEAVDGGLSADEVEVSLGLSV